MRISDSHRRDFSAYLSFARRIGESFQPSRIDAMPRGQSSALQCFAEIETKGKTAKNPRQLLTLRKAMMGKALLNLHIKMWAEGAAELADILPPRAAIAEVHQDFPWLPDWVWVAIEKQAARRMKAKVI